MIRLGFWRLPKPWTVPRAHAFAALVKSGPAGAIVSNATTLPDDLPSTGHDNPGTIYWQTADFLIDQGIASHYYSGDPFHGFHSTRIFLTDAGERLRDELGPCDSTRTS